MPGADQAAVSGIVSRTPPDVRAGNHPQTGALSVGKGWVLDHEFFCWRLQGSVTRYRLLWFPMRRSRGLQRSLVLTKSRAAFPHVRPSFRLAGDPREQSKLGAPPAQNRRKTLRRAAKEAAHVATLLQNGPSK